MGEERLPGAAEEAPSREHEHRQGGDPRKQPESPALSDGRKPSQHIAHEQGHAHGTRNGRPAQQPAVVRHLGGFLLRLVVQPAHLSGRVARLGDGADQLIGCGRAPDDRRVIGEIDLGVAHAGHAAQGILDCRDAARAAHPGDRETNLRLSLRGPVGPQR